MLTLTPPGNIVVGTMLDIAAIARDEDFQDLTNFDLYGERDLAGWVGSLDIDPASLSGVLTMGQGANKWDGELLYILEGDFEFADLRADLEDLEYEETSYREYEVWEDRGGRDYYALVGEGQYVLRSKSEDAVKAALNSLYREVSLANAEDNDLKRVLDKVGRAPMVWFINEDRCGIKRCQGYGVAFGGYDAVAEEIPMTFVLLFSSAQAAERAADEYDEVATFVEEQTLRGGNIDIADIASDGEFVVGSGKFVPPEPAAVMPAPAQPAAPTASPAMPAAALPATSPLTKPPEPTWPPLTKPPEPTWPPLTNTNAMPDYLSVREHSLYATDGATPGHFVFLLTGDFSGSLWESPATVSVNSGSNPIRSISVKRLLWPIIFGNYIPN